MRSARRASTGTPRARVLLACAVSIQKRAVPRPKPRVSIATWESIQTCPERRASARAKTAPLPPSRPPAARPGMLALQVCWPRVGPKVWVGRCAHTCRRMKEGMLV